MGGEAYFQTVCDAGDQAAAIRALSDGQLRELLGHCDRECGLGSITCEVWGMALCESSTRWMAMENQDMTTVGGMA